MNNEFIEMFKDPNEEDARKVLMYVIRDLGTKMYLRSDDSLTPKLSEALLHDDISRAVHISFQLYNTEVVSVNVDGNVEEVPLTN
ncbi:hypothetical protein H1230_16815 [Paenibacillus sp. 19GGS1-52]|uniref:hypothetical protein n=1 Tax=Paenibacillus sp. 19GGS1-52 TaxID=2758563 RepID=UPI001EFA708F|nr:hypothetical protein [Paenibacillus sp. 19GGS1-52]ULO04809.1 hypothetical protein H1230_16815 [Paenibacillus sp. 19GGS1-52]